MKTMKKIFIFILLLAFTFNSFGQKADTIIIGKQNLELNHLNLGNSTYIVYFKKTATSPAERLTLVKINIESTVINGKKAFAITQKWDSGEDLTHTAYTVHDATDFSTIRQDTWWKRLGYTAKYDFTTKQVAFEGTIEDAVKAEIVKDFNDSFENYNLCWHSDLVIFPLFPFKNGRTFKVNFYDPGFGKSEIAEYTVTGSDFLTGSSGGEKINCWVMEYSSKSPSGATATQRFWISKKSREVLKEEDQSPYGFRYKLKIGISGEK
jgi:hypothetical protein